MVGGEELDVVAGEVEETGGGKGSDGCLSADFWGWRRGSVRILRDIRGSKGFSAGGGGIGMGGGGPSSDIGAIGAVKRGGDGVWDGLELTVFRIRDRSSKSGREEVEEEGAGGSKEEGGGWTGGGCE